MVDILQHPRHLCRFAHTVAVMRQRSEALLRKCTCGERSDGQRARVTRASGGFRFFAFTSSLLGRISLKTSILRVKIPLSSKTDYLSIIQQLRGEGSNLHLGTCGGLAPARQKRRSKIPPRHGGAEGEGSAPKSTHLCLHPQHAVPQMITKNFNTRLHDESFTHIHLIISRLKAKAHAVKEEKRKLAECA